LYTGEPFTFAGQHYRVRDARCAPRPDPDPPLLSGAFRPRMLRLAAEFGDWWGVSSTGVATYRRLARQFEDACAAAGRDPGAVRRSWSGGCACAPTGAEAVAVAGDRFSPDAEEDFGFVGTPAQVVEQMRAFIALGVSYFIVDCSEFPNLTTLELLVKEVLPALHD
ncbi:MAG: LLM class flavin-dependent oxidoreductase, partial [Chloroflexota bacterium]